MANGMFPEPSIGKLNIWVWVNSGCRVQLPSPLGETPEPKMSSLLPRINCCWYFICPAWSWLGCICFALLWCQPEDTLWIGYSAKTPNQGTFTWDEIHLCSFSSFSINKTLRHYWIFHVSSTPCPSNFRLKYLPFTRPTSPLLPQDLMPPHFVTPASLYWMVGHQDRCIFASSTMPCVQLQHSINK